MRFRNLLALLLIGCVTRNIELPSGTQGFKVTVTDTINGFGTAAAPLPFATADSPVTFTLNAQAIGWGGGPDSSFTGTVFIEAHPGSVTPNEMNIVRGRGSQSVSLFSAFGEARVWIEDCGFKTAAANPNCTSAQLAAWDGECIPGFKTGTLATGITPAFFFGNPSIENTQVTADNTTSPLIAQAGDRCAALADPRFVDVTGLTSAQLLAIPAGDVAPKSGQFVHIAPRCLTGGQCESNGTACAADSDCGRIIVQSITNEGFYATDVVPPSIATLEQGFRSIFVFNFSYPAGLRIGDALLSLQGSPTEFSGDTQLQNPAWQRDPAGPYPDLIPKPVYITPAVYAANVSSSGANVNTALDLERLESALVCMDGLSVPGTLTNCDLNQNGSIERGGQLCLIKQAGGPFIACLDATADNPLIDCTVDCGATSCPAGQSLFVPANAPERCCEAACYADPNCIEQSSYQGYQQWGATIAGLSPAQKIGVNSSQVGGFDPSAFVQKYATQQQSPPTIAVTGNLVQVLASRPVWIITPRGSDDFVVGGTCPQ